MRALRTLVSALCILAGALMVVAWAASSAAVRAVEDGSALSGLTRAAFSVPSVVESISTRAKEQVIGTIEDSGVNPAAVGIEDTVRTAVDDAVRSDEFEQAVAAAAEDADDQFVVALTDPDREAAPLVLAVNVSGVVNARIDEIPAVGAVAPDLSLPPAEFEVVDAATFETVRSTYGVMTWLAAWGLWVGLALLAIGMLVTHRRRWFVAKALLAIGVLTFGFGIVVRFVDPDAVLAVLPGGDEGTLGALWASVVTEEAAPAIAQRSLLIGAVALVGAAIAAALGKAARRR
ncbi:hypothetical protein [Demequina sp. NBRC 110055]|uniref:hypothetical protein n=1 Tax=Demequina sp. NBRC 110055 TaxID=1570344 RepID=UPI000A06517A|nr:hypothetical protein [Demequina sp. NBRC 110055]